MAFEPLQTDEKVDRPVRGPADMDTQMLGGCSAFVVSAFITYGLGIWPFFVLPNLHLLQPLAYATAIGLGTTCVFGALASWRGGLAPACGFFAGSLTLAVFLHLFQNQIALGHTVPDLPRPDYPASMGVFLPLGWTLIALLFAVIFARIGEKRRVTRDEKRR